MNLSVIGLFVRRLFRERTIWVLPVTAFAVASALTLAVAGGVHFFWTIPGEMGAFYKVLSSIALALLVLPLASLAGAAARLLARRRDERLSSLRLIGASTATLTGLAVVEATVLAAVGALVGVVGWAVLMPLIGLLPFAGGRIGVPAQWIGAPGVLAVLAGLTLVAAVSSLTGLRRIAITPLGVRTRQRAQAVHWVRLLVFGALVVGGQLMIAAARGSADMGIAIAVVLVALAVPLLALHLLGPWVLSLGAKLRLRRARTPEALVAARTVLDAPRQAWQQVGALSVTTYVGVMAGAGLSLATQGEATVSRPEELILMQDLRTGVLVTVLISFVLAACSVALNQSAQVVDRAELHRGLSYAGMPVQRIHAMRRTSVMLALGTVMVVSVGAAMITGAPLISASVLFAPLSLLVVVGTLVAGVLLVRAGVDVTAPALRRSVATA